MIQLLRMVMLILLGNVAFAETFGEFPPGGGPLSFVNQNDFEVHLLGLDITSEEGKLVPIPPGGSQRSWRSFRVLAFQLEESSNLRKPWCAGCIPSEQLH